MLDGLIGAALVVGAVIILGWAANKISIEITNKPLHALLFERFKTFVLDIYDWCQTNANVMAKGTRIFLRIAVDKASVQMKRAKRNLLSAIAVLPDGAVKEVMVTEEVMTDDAVRELGFSPLKRNPQLLECMTVSQV